MRPRVPRLLISGSADGSLPLWNVQIGRTLASLDLGGEVASTTFVPGTNQRWIIASGAKGQVRLIDLRYYDQHIAGNTGYFLARLGDGLPAPAKIDELLRWARQASGNDALRFDDPAAGLGFLPYGATNRAVPAPVVPSRD